MAGKNAWIIVSEESMDRPDQTWYVSLRFTNDILTIEVICLSRRILESNCTPRFLKESACIMFSSPMRNSGTSTGGRYIELISIISVLPSLSLWKFIVSQRRVSEITDPRAILVVSFRVIKDNVQLLLSAQSSYDTPWSVIIFQSGIKFNTASTGEPSRCTYWKDSEQVCHALPTRGPFWQRKSGWLFTNKPCISPSL